MLWLCERSRLKRTTKVVGNYDFWGIDVALVEAYVLTPQTRRLQRNAGSCCVATEVPISAAAGVAPGVERWDVLRVPQPCFQL